MAKISDFSAIYREFLRIERLFSKMVLRFEINVLKIVSIDAICYFNVFKVIIKNKKVVKTIFSGIFREYLGNEISNLKTVFRFEISRVDLVQIRFIFYLKYYFLRTKTTIITQKIRIFRILPGISCEC